MTEPLSITASVLAITTAAIESIKFLHTTIGAIEDVPTALETITSDLEAIEPVLRKLYTELKSEDSPVLLADNIKGAVENCNSACSAFKERLDHWMRHATKHQTLAKWTVRVKVGIFEQRTINVFKGRLNDCKSTLNVVLNTSSVFAVARQGLIIKEVKDSMLKSNEVHLAKEEARANHELTAIERSMEELSVSIRDEVNEESKRDLGQLLEEMQEQKAANEVFRKTCEEALLESKNIHDGIEQEIKKTEADNNSRAVVGLINTDGEVRNIKQNISETSAKGGSFAGAGIIRGLDLTIPGSRNR